MEKKKALDWFMEQEQIIDNRLSTLTSQDALYQFYDGAKAAYKHARHHMAVEWGEYE